MLDAVSSVLLELLAFYTAYVDVLMIRHKRAFCLHRIVDYNAFL